MNHFDWKPFLKSVAAIAIPVALQNLLTTTGSVVDTMMLAPLGETAVGAVGLAAQFASLLFSTYWGFVGGGMLFFGQFWGAKDEDGLNHSYGITMAFLMTIACAFTLAGLLFPETVMRLYTDKDVFHALGARYLRIMCLSFPLQVLASAMSALLRSIGQVRTPLYASIVSVVSNVALNYVLIFGRLGFPALGVQGAAVATVTASLLNVLVLVFFAVRERHPCVLEIRRHYGWSRALLRQFVQKSFPIIFNELGIGISNMLINMILGRQAAAAVVANVVFRNIESIVIAFFWGFSNSATVLVGTQVGAGELDVAYERGKRLVGLCGAVTFFVCLMIVAAHTPLLTAMGLSGESFRLCTQMLLIYCVIAVVRMMNWQFNDTYRAAGNPHFGSILEIVFIFGMVVPAMYLTGIVWRCAFLIVFLCRYSDELIRLAMMVYHFYTGKWVRPITPEGQAALPAFMAKRRLKGFNFGLADREQQRE